MTMDWGVADMKEVDRINIFLESNDSDGFLTIDNDKIIDCNSRFQEILGSPSEKDIVGHRFYQLSLDTQPNGKKTFDLYKEMIDEAQLNGKSRFEYQFRSVLGEPIHTEVVFISRDLEKKEIIYAIIKDIYFDIVAKDSTLQETEVYRSRFNNGLTPIIEESYFKSLYENSPEAIAILDNELRIKNINSSFERIFQYSLDEIRHQNITNILGKEKLYDESTYFKDRINCGEFVRQETHRKRKDGKLVDVSFLEYPILSNGEQIGVYNFYDDLSNKKKTVSKERVFSEIFKNNTVGVVVTDIEGNIEWINDMFTEVTGYAIEEIAGQKPSILKSGKYETEYYSNMWNSILKEGKWQGEICNKRKNGEIYQEWLSIIAIRDDKGNIECFVGMLSEITDAKQQENKIEILTSRDSLTDLYNRDYFINKLNYEMLIRNKEQESKQELAVIFLDIDGFKDINDALGHLVGDSVLKEFAFRLKGSLRTCDIAARFGGDEFIILLMSIKEDYELLSIANRIIEETEKSFFIDNVEMHITVSLGISRYPKDGIDSNTLIRNADVAMYKSKEIKYKKITLFEPSLDEQVKEYLKIKNSLRNAITNKEFTLVYQPIFDVNKGILVGVEALLRWNLSGGESYPPTKFIPVAEKNGLMPAIGEWVLKAACEQNKAWQDKGHSTMVISVNVSIVQLEQPNFLDVVKRVLKESKLHPRYLQLEITETIFIKDYEGIAQTIKRINSLGVEVAIDDFGTGYSSLGQLSRLEVTKLKIDRSFISEINETGNKNKIIKAIISLGESLNLELVAEGVETKEQLDFLIKNNCHIVQGFLFSEPVSAIELEKQFQI